MLQRLLGTEWKGIRIGGLLSRLWGGMERGVREGHFWVDEQ